MTIYVDEAVWPYRGTMYCHMMTDGDIQELHDLAAKLGLRRSWFQNTPSGKHYDLSQNKRVIRNSELKPTLVHASPKSEY